MEAAPVRSLIRAVSVYRQGARVTRVAELAASGSELPSAVRLTGLPLTMDDGSVRVRVEPAEPADGDREALPVAADARVALEVPEEDSSLPPADDRELDKARREVARLRSQVALLERELGRISNLRVAPRPKGAEGEPPPASPTEARLALLELREQREQRIRDEMAAARDELDKADRRCEALEEADRRASTARQAHAHELRKTVQVTLRGGNGTCDRARVFLEYLVPGARWAPAYMARLDEGMAQASLAMRAVVAQNTGEDWAGVALTLSTADAQRWTELPELGSLRIGRRQPAAPKVGWRPPPTGVEELYGDYDRGFAEGLDGGERAAAVRKDETTAFADYEQEAEDTDKVFVGDYRGDAARHEDFDDAETGVAMRPVAGAPPSTTLAQVMSPAMASESVAVESSMKMEKKNRGFGLGGLFRSRQAPADDLVPEPEEGFAPPAPQAYAMPMGGVAGFDRAIVPAEEEAGLLASEDMLSYGTLRMPSPRAETRGHLTVVAQQEIYLELLMRQKIAVSFDVMSAVGDAASRAHAVEHADLPPRCLPAWAEDYDYAYVADAPLDIPSDGEFHSIPITSHQAAARPLYVVVPRESTDVFRTVKLENPLDAPLLGGPIDVYWRDDFLLTSELEFTAPRGEVRLGLGVEQAIKVSRNTRYREESAGLMGGSLDLEHQILIEALNHTEHRVDLEVRERVPVLRDGEEEIKFEVKEVSPPWERFDPFPSSAGAPELRGGHRWQVELEPGVPRKLRVDYSIRIAAKHELVGGNRREV